MHASSCMWNMNFQLPANKIQPTSTNCHIINQALFQFSPPSKTITTLQETNMSPTKDTFEDDVPFPEVGYVSFLEGNFQNFQKR